ncbi:POZ domain-containing protein [Westerdykella ornata]|uniref:Elongin-C n=1 Tax=Westerdykella ornata TaxID=318751 RepID=A0A6A6JSV1_WESOR|nr:POZ domain-containing protein [Westerdykella ornata]KAF2279467.1 POZ domain-containing protein [Westerdykella ornata]
MPTPEPSEYVTIVSSDGFEFKILRSAACISGALRKAFDPASGFREQVESRFVLENFPGVVVEKICEYLYYNQKYAEAKDVPDMEIPAELCLELVTAADYLDC